MTAPNDRRYAETHEWHKLEGDTVIIGVSQFAVEELTDITYVEVFETSGDITAGDSFGEIESVKATSELYCGVDGIIAEVNDRVIEDPSIINRSPFEDGWIVKIKPSSPDQLDALMDAATYQATCCSS